MPSPTLANLEGNLRRLKNAERALFSELWGAGSVGRRGLGPNRYKLNQHTKLSMETIPALKRRIENRKARNERVRVARARQVMRRYTRKLHARIYRPPNAGGAMYRRTAATTALRRTRSAGTSMSPRRSPKRRNMGTSP